jgi:hypothetical protein
MINKHPWLFKLTHDYSWDASDFIDPQVEFVNPWLSIRDSVITVSEDYAWNGCSPKLSIFDLWVLGGPDGRLRHGLPITYHASLVHDALTQFRTTLPITHQQATAIFDAMLKESGFACRKLYVLLVKLFAPLDFKGNVDSSSEES